VTKGKSKSHTGKKKKPAKKGAKRAQGGAKKKRSSGGVRIKPDTYNALQRAYYEDQDITAAAKAAGVTRRTATKYIKGKGDPARGMMPIHDRWLRVQAEAQDRADLTHARMVTKAKRMLDGALDSVTAELYLYGQDVKRRVKAYQENPQEVAPLPAASLKNLIAALDRAARLFDRLEGGPDLRVGFQLDDLMGLTEEEALDAVTTGVLPAQLGAFKVGGGAPAGGDEPN